MQELISVIMPAYNAARTISEAVESVIAQTYRNWELIIIDDCSTDSTVSIASRYAEKEPRIRIIYNTENQGASRARHNGVMAANGKWLAFLDSDDLWIADKLEKQMNLHLTTGSRLIFTASAFIDAEGRGIDYVLHVPAGITYRELLKQNIISNSSVLIDRQLFLKHESVGSDMHEDFACWLNVIRAGETACGIDEPLLTYRVSADSKSGNKLRAAAMNWRTYRAVGLSFPETIYYMCCYAVNGFRKYSKLSSKFSTDTTEQERRHAQC